MLDPDYYINEVKRLKDVISLAHLTMRAVRSGTGQSDALLEKAIAAVEKECPELAPPKPVYPKDWTGYKRYYRRIKGFESSGILFVTKLPIGNGDAEPEFFKNLPKQILSIDGVQFDAYDTHITERYEVADEAAQELFKGIEMGQKGDHTLQMLNWET